MDFLVAARPATPGGVVAAFYQGLREAGFIEGKNVQIAFRWAEGRYDRLPALAADLVGIRVTALFVAGGPPSALAAKAATSTIPIVFSAVNDPVELGLVASLNRPGGNVTGMSTFAAEIWAKSVELLKELVPTATVIAYLVNPSSPSAGYLKGAAMAASTLGIDVRVLNAGTEQEVSMASLFATLPNLRVGGLACAANEPFLDTQRVKIVALSARYAVPAVYCLREYVEDGGLMSYGFNLEEAHIGGPVSTLAGFSRVKSRPIFPYSSQKHLN